MKKKATFRYERLVASKCKKRRNEWYGSTVPCGGNKKMWAPSHVIRDGGPTGLLAMSVFVFQSKRIREHYAATSSYNTVVLCIESDGAILSLL